MSRIPVRAAPPAAIAPLAALLLSGCLGGLLGGGKPAQMYRFGGATSTGAAVPAEGQAPAASRVVQLPPPAFAAEIDGDRMLASRGAAETLYIKGARWTASTPELFAAALHEAFRRRAPAIALVDRRDGAASAPVLRIEVERFEAHYDSADKDAVPTARIEGQAVLVAPKGDAAGVRYRFAASQPAASGRIDDIVAAFDTADARVVDAVADWVVSQRP